MDKRTKQKWFNQVLRHMRKQGKKSVDVGGNCLYRGPDGLKCAIGALLPDELLRSRTEGLDVYSLLTGLRSSLVRRRRAHLGVTNVGDISFLGDLQGDLHDCLTRDLCLLEPHARGLAKTHNLKYTPVRT